MVALEIRQRGVPAQDVEDDVGEVLLPLLKLLL